MENNALVVMNDPVKALSALFKARVGFVNLTPKYLDIDGMKEGYSFRGFYLGIANSVRRDEETGEEKELKCAYFKTENGNVFSAAKMLVGTMEEAESKGFAVKNETPVEVTYLGKKKNKTNAFSSADFNVDILVFQNEAEPEF